MEGVRLIIEPVLIIGLLLLMPLLAAGLLLVIRGNGGRKVVVVGFGVLIMLGTILLAVGYLVGDPWQGSFHYPLIDYCLLAIDVVIGLYILAKSIKYKKLLAGALAVAQMAGILAFEFLIAPGVSIASDLYIDGLSVIMALIIGIIGSGICIYALGYMKDHECHAREDDPTCKDRRPIFFALMFLFLAAMFAIVFFNNLAWLFCAWEITTVCSFALIGYTRTDEAIANSFRQIVMNQLGGLAFVIALILLGLQGILELDVVISHGNLGLLGLPIILLAFAGMTKAAQVPFQSWLLGAMVAPTPTSALLHSSTMVKAGVFMVIKLAPALGWNANGIAVMLIGGFTFLFCSAIAISQPNAKRVLAYSTVANLGLIVACAGVGTPEAVWAAIFLLIFHAVAKSLLFLCVGTAEHNIGSRDIEEMDNLFIRMPKLAMLMALGILTMFIAPFGMLISKWATIVSLVETGNAVLLIILAFGSAVTFMFWAKWLGKMLAVAGSQSNVETAVHRSEWSTIGLMAVLVIGLSVGFPFVSEMVVVPYLACIWNVTGLDVISFDNLLIMAIIVLAVVLSFLVFVWRSKKRTAPIYLSGVGLDFEERTYLNSLSQETKASQRNWYMDGWFSEQSMTPLANTCCIAVLVFGMTLSLLSLGGWSL
ncbi:MAG TPA: NADH-quinone oxidoreductase subunit L [Coriobacteriia bacterium]|nr:NADH-quinone oxidoreductase subunit L [Coriobacteriia bacterium]